MRLIFVTLSVAIAAALAGCTSPATPYQPFVAYGGHGIHGGYSDQSLAEDRILVRFHGNSMTSRDRVEGYMLYRAAELTVQNGYEWFTLADRNTEHNVRTIVEPDPFYHPWYGGGYGAWRPDWSFYSPGFGWTSWYGWGGAPWPSYDVRQIEAFETTAEIDMHKGALRAGDPRAIDARKVIADLGPSIERPKP